MTKTAITTDKPRIDDAEMVQQVFGSITADTLPLALGSALTDLAKLAFTMQPDDVCLNLDLPAGTLSFRAYRRAGRA